MIPVCDRCARYIEASNREWPGYCSPGCRDRAAADRLKNEARARRRQRPDEDEDAQW